MTEKNIQVYPYRWVILGAFMLINLTIQILWICFAPISGPAAKFFGVSDQQIGFLAMSFMVIYIPLSLPVSWLIDRWGYRKAVSLGAGLLGIFGMLRAVVPADFGWMLVCTVGIACAQPFILNSVSTVAAKWFPIQERATAAGLAIVASFMGVAIGEVTSPMIILSYGIPTMLMIYGIAAALSAVLFILLTREAPPTPPCLPGHETRALVLDGLKSMLQQRDIWLLLFLFLVGMGIFNGVSTWIEEIVRPRGFSITEAGDLGGFLLLGGIVGAIVIPALSDRFRRRKIFLLGGIILAIPGLIGFTFATNYVWMVLSMFSLGFFLMSLAPVGYQYAAEITYPAPEGTSNGLLNLAGQASVVFIYAMEAFKSSDGTFTFSLVILVILMAICGVLIPRLNESTMLDARVEMKAE